VMLNEILEIETSTITTQSFLGFQKAQSLCNICTIGEIFDLKFLYLSKLLGVED
jgi:hypothetical protein